MHKLINQSRVKLWYLIIFILLPIMDINLLYRGITHLKSNSPQEIAVNRKNNSPQKLLTSRNNSPQEITYTLKNYLHQEISAFNVSSYSPGFITGLSIGQAGSRMGHFYSSYEIFSAYNAKVRTHIAFRDEFKSSYF